MAITSPTVHNIESLELPHSAPLSAVMQEHTNQPMPEQIGREKNTSRPSIDTQSKMSHNHYWDEIVIQMTRAATVPGLSSISLSRDIISSQT